MDVLDRARALAATDVLGAVPPAALVALAERARVIELDGGATIATRRDGGGVVLVIASGQVGDHGAGALVGAAAAFDSAAPAESLDAAEPSVVLELGHDDFIDVLAEHAVAAAALARAMARALRAGG